MVFRGVKSNDNTKQTIIQIIHTLIGINKKFFPFNYIILDLIGL